MSFDAIRTELEVPQHFPPDVLAEADQQAVKDDLGDRIRLDLPFVTIDPPTSMDLDQAIHLARSPRGFDLHYAIADVAAFVPPGGALDAEAWKRAVTLYSPDTRTPLYPPQLSEDRASLLPGHEKPALVWIFRLDDVGGVSSVQFASALVRSVAKLDYQGVQDSIDRGDPHESISALAELGPILLHQARERGAIELPIPDQEVVRGDDGSWQLSFRSQLPVERWNAQVSLLTGRSAAAMMLDAGVGMLRTLPPPEDRAVRRLRRVAAALGISWAEQDSPATVLSSVDGGSPREVAFIEEAAGLLRGSGYLSLGGQPGSSSTARGTDHAGVGAPYAHVTAPLRRLADRYVNEVCLAIASERTVADWARSRLAELPEAMAAGNRRDSELERACLDATEAAILTDRVGDTFAAVVVGTDERGATVVLTDLAVRGRCSGRAKKVELGDAVHVRVTQADAANRKVGFDIVDGAPVQVGVPEPPR